MRWAVFRWNDCGEIIERHAVVGHDFKTMSGVNRKRYRTKCGMDIPACFEDPTRVDVDDCQECRERMA